MASVTTRSVFAAGASTKPSSESFTLAPARIGDEGQAVREDAPAAAIPFDRVRRASRIHIFTRPQKPGKGAKPGKARKSPAKEVR